MKITNKHNLPAAFVNSIGTDRHAPVGTLTASTFSSGLREIILFERRFDEIEKDAIDFFHTFFGIAVHERLEKFADEGDFTEYKIESDMFCVPVTGTVDSFKEEAATVSDWKTATSWKIMFNDYRDWYIQGIVYAFLLRSKGYKVNKVVFNAFIRDWSPTKAEREDDYPKLPFHTYTLYITSDDMTNAEEVIRKRTEEYVKYKDTPDEFLPPCSDEERWASPKVFAVMKKDAKKSSKNCSTREEAEEAAEKLKAEVVERPRTYKKCEKYCDVKQWCQGVNE